MSILQFCRHTLKQVYWSLVLLIMLFPCSALAAEQGIYSWEIVLNKIANSVTGPVAYAISIIVIFGTGCTAMFADLQTASKRAVQVTCGLSIAFFAAQIVTQFLGFSGAVI